MPLTQEFVGTLVIVTCGADGCSLTFGMSQEFYDARRKDHRTWYCPDGHPRCYNGESDLQREKRLRAAAERSRSAAWAHATAADDQRRATERSNRALRGHLTRARNKIANGVCPVGNCRRHFDNVQAHIASEHPSWSVMDPETGKAAVL